MYYFVILLNAVQNKLSGLLRRCVTCRSRGELGTCKDPFTLNSTEIQNEHGVKAEPCASGWCGKIIEAPNLNNGMLFIIRIKIYFSAIILQNFSILSVSCRISY